jgi:hypothetical protein
LKPEGWKGATFTGDNARMLARFLLSLGRARAGLGFDPDRFEAAEANLLEANQLFVATRGEDHEGTRDSVQALADFYAAWGTIRAGRGPRGAGSEVDDRRVGEGVTPLPYNVFANPWIPAQRIWRPIHSVTNAMMRFKA